MAFKRYKRFKYRKARKNRYRRSRFTRYSRRRSSKRVWRNRRFPKSTEVKSIAGGRTTSWNVNYSVSNNKVIWPEYPMRSFCFPAPELAFELNGVAGKQTNNFDIEDGTGISERVGGKIKPLKLRIFGSMSLNDPYLSIALLSSNNNFGSDNQTTGWQESDVRLSFAVRLFVYQVRGGNSSEHPQTKPYHPLALVNIQNSTSGINDMCDHEQVQKLLASYAHDAGGATYDSMVKNISAVNQPLRLGIGGQFRMLYTKVFYLSSMKPSRPFRIVTKVPRRLVWPEIQNGADDIVLSNYARNSIFIAWLLIPLNPPKALNPAILNQAPSITTIDRTVDLAYNVQLFYTDK